LIKLKRVYDPPSEDDGYRILVDRLWPRGLPKSKARIDLWLRDIAPSNELRKWFSHKPERWEEFKKRYREELKNKEELLRKLIELEKHYGVITLLYAAKDREHNNAVVLREVLEEIKSEKNI